MTGTTELTPRQDEIYRFIIQTIRKTTCSPTVREIGEEFGIRSPNGVVCTLRALERKGVITRESRMSRGIRLVAVLGAKEKCPMCGRGNTV